jgi:hypothetical protein
MESHFEAENVFLEYLRPIWSLGGSLGALEACLEPWRLTAEPRRPTLELWMLTLVSLRFILL